MQAGDALRQLRRPRGCRPRQCGPEPDDRSEQHDDQKKGAQYSGHTKSIQHPDGRLQKKRKDEGKDDRQHDLPRRVEGGEQREEEEAALEDRPEVGRQRHLGLVGRRLVRFRASQRLSASPGFDHAANIFGRRRPGARGRRGSGRGFHQCTRSTPHPGFALRPSGRAVTPPAGLPGPLRRTGTEVNSAKKMRV